MKGKCIEKQNDHTTGISAFGERLPIEKFSKF